MLVFVHHVRPGRHKEYEALMTEIWGTALNKVARSGNQLWAWTLAARRDLVPLTSPSKDSTTTYVYLIDPAPPQFFSDTGTFPQSLLIEAGYSREQADSLDRRLDATVSAWHFYPRVQRPFGGAQP
ncbi:MAG: hypothetical protein H0T68_06820 [Gemmatimonadales bacterium]|nr:hypothetical protein [Gemmatimonadales bacterium]